MPYAPYAIHFPKCLIKNKEHRKYLGSCGFGINYCSIDSDGNLKMCSYLPDILGNVFNESLNDIWKNHSFFKQARAGKWLPYLCKKCDIKYKCMSGCKASSQIKPFGLDVLLQTSRDYLPDTYIPSISSLYYRKESERRYIILNKNGKIFKVNKIGKLIVDLCNGQNTVADISKMLSKKYQVSEKKIKKDVREFINYLIKGNFFEINHTCS